MNSTESTTIQPKLFRIRKLIWCAVAFVLLLVALLWIPYHSEQTVVQEIERVGGETPAAKDTKGLVEGNIKISRDESATFGPSGPSAVKLVRVWKYNTHQSSADWLKENYAAKHKLQIGIEGTPYSILILDGEVTPLISANHTSEIWLIKGLELDFKAIDVLNPKNKMLELVAGGGDMRSIWLLDFSRGLTIVYREEYDGP